jgi:hypothetical protein
MSAAADIYRCTPRQISKFVSECLLAGLVPFVQSSPGMGKSSIMRQVAKRHSLKLIDHRLSTSAPEDLSGLPEFHTDANGNRRAHFVPFGDLFPIEGDEVPDGFDGWMLFMDEFNSAPKSVQAASYKLILDRMTGQLPLHERCVLTAAGNLSTDRAITNPISTAMQSRVVHLEMKIDFEEWLYDVALAESYDSRVIAYLSQYPSKLMDFRPDHNEKTFCCPRTWEFTNRLIKDNSVTDEKASLLAGTITSGVAVDFVQFTKVFNNLVSVEEIRKDPKGCRIPSDNSSRWAVISHMMEKVNDENFSDLSQYANRFTLDFRVLFFRSTMVRNPGLRQHPAFITAMSELARYLHG